AVVLGTSIEEETRAVFRDGDVRFVLVAREMFALAGDDFAAQVHAMVAQEGPAHTAARIDPLALGGGAQGFRVTPALSAGSQLGNYVMRTWVALADGTVQHLSFFVNQAAMRHAGTYQALAERVVASIQPGRLALPRAAGPRRLDTGFADQDLV